MHVIKIVLLSFLFITTLRAEIRYKTSFGKCPAKAAGTLTLKLVKEFEKTRSLRSVKMKILREKLDSEHFISEYSVRYNPLKEELKLKFDCPEPLMKVHLFKKDQHQHYEAILVDNGKLFDPTYEVLMRAEKKLKHYLPSFAFPVGELDKKIQLKMANLFKTLSKQLKKQISEVILDEQNKLTVILSVEDQPVSAFIGSTEWKSKLKKLDNIISFMQIKKKVPAIVNLTNSKKVVVKFSDKS